VHVFLKSTNPKLSDNFTGNEFHCQCKSLECHKTWVSDSLITKLQAVRDDFGEGIIITSGYRCASHQASLRTNPLLKTASGKSTHEMGCAVDIRPVNLTTENMDELLVVLGRHFKSIGLAINFFHVDTRLDKDKRRWKY